ncbi:hypothetical protein [Gimesia panareensis]|uniref:Uncharacterized protein n=1 Tax=Gimesia panareensis TaxID=2527978 RepID=A0A518A3T2_9PLAN|nr:hypothetical protein [Gimesia panareensis]QDU49301.1 hypothetical protein Pan110_16200 [Gimesia panareensis]QDV17463.1 hypothetical protein Pan153_21160 [Gimesia panareensis]
MNQEQKSQGDFPAESASPKKRNPLERLLVWGGIIILLGVVLIEYRAKQNYDATVSALQEVANGERDIPINEARNLMVGYSQSEGPVPNQQGLNTYHYQWFSLLKSGTYQITLVENKDRLLKTFDGPAFAEDPDVLAARIKEANSDDVESTPPLIGNALPQKSNKETPTEDGSNRNKTTDEKNSKDDGFLN